MKRLLLPLVFVCSGVLFALLLLEFAVRVLFSHQIVLFPRYVVAKSYGEYSIRSIMPSITYIHTSIDGRWKFTINSNGFRNYVDYNYDKGNKLRVLCIGDSHTLGYEVGQDQTYAAVIEKYLQQRGYEVEVINAGVSGFSNAEELIFLEQEGIKYKPDIVVLGFYANDFEDNIRTGLFALDDNKDLVVVKKEYLPGAYFQQTVYRFGIMRWLHEHSYLYSWIMNIAQEVYKRQLTQQARSQLEEFAMPKKDTYTDYEMELARKIIEKMIEVSHRHQAKLLFIDIPSSKGRGQFQSSVPLELKSTFKSLSDGYLDSELLLGDYRGIVDIHVPHGHHHISPFTHAVLGVASAKEIVKWHPTPEK